MKKIILIIILIFGFIFTQNPVFSQEQDIYSIAYLNRLQNSVKSNWILPHGQEDKKTVVVFDIDKNGNISNSSIFESSGDKEFDEVALFAISQSSPFEPFPQSISNESIKISFTFTQDELDATLISGTGSTKQISQVAQVACTSKPTVQAQSTIASVNKPVKEIKSKKQAKVKKVKKKTCNYSNVNGTPARRGKVTPKTVGAGALSLLIWPGLGQLVNNGPCEKAGTHAILGIINIFRIWSCYDAVVDRQGGAWEGRL